MCDMWRSSIAACIFTSTLLYDLGEVQVEEKYCQFEQSHRVTLSGAKGLSREEERCFAPLRVTGLDLAGG